MTVSSTIRGAILGLAGLTSLLGLIAYLTVVNFHEGRERVTLLSMAMALANAKIERSAQSIADGSTQTRVAGDAVSAVEAEKETLNRHGRELAALLRQLELMPLVAMADEANAVIGAMSQLAAGEGLAPDPQRDRIHARALALRRLTGAITQGLEAEIQAANAGPAVGSERSAGWNLGAAFVLLGLVFFFVFNLIERRVLTRLSRVEARANNVMNGQLEPTKVMSRADEIATLDRVVDRLRRLTIRHNLSERDLGRAHAMAEASAKSKADFLSLVSHEVRTPLNGIIGMFELIAQSDVSQRQRERAWKGREAAQNLFQLLSKVLDASRLEAQSVKVNRANVSISDLASFAQDTADAALAKQNRKVAIVVSCSHENLLLNTDPVLLRQILSNLIDNAARFTPEGKIHVAFLASPETGIMEISVQDTGVGISEDKVPLIFERFRQVGGDWTMPAGGSGLGLSISRELAALLGGDLVYRPREPKGSTFLLTLPLQQVELDESYGSYENLAS